MRQSGIAGVVFGVASLAVLAAGCPGKSDDDGGITAENVPLDGACDMALDQGGFTVSHAGVEGSVADGVVPISVLEQLHSEGDCLLLRRNNPYCDPGCDPGQTCTFDGVCVPYPANQDLGVIAIEGLASDVSMDPVFPGNTYFDTSLPDPPYTSGTLVTLTVPEDGTYGPATLHGVGVDPLAGTDAEWIVDSGVDLPVSWTAPAGDGARSSVLLEISIDQHGATPGLVRCVFEDDGDATVPGGILQRLVDSGVTGFPTGRLVRQTVDREPAGDGCMDLTIQSEKTIEVDVVGFTPCVDDEDCPEGESCNIELQVCESDG